MHYKHVVSVVIIKIPNTHLDRAMNHDRETYGPDVDEFRPERHLNEKGLLIDEKTEGHYSYGFGSRFYLFQYPQSKFTDYLI